MTIRTTITIDELMPDGTSERDVWAIESESVDTVDRDRARLLVAIGKGASEVVGEASVEEGDRAHHAMVYAEEIGLRPLIDGEPGALISDTHDCDFCRASRARRQAALDDVPDIRSMSDEGLEDELRAIQEDIDGTIESGPMAPSPAVAEYANALWAEQIRRADLRVTS